MFLVYTSYVYVFVFMEMKLDLFHCVNLMQDTIYSCDDFFSLHNCSIVTYSVALSSVSIILLFTISIFCFPMYK